jgi:hypothetical protein
MLIIVVLKSHYFIISKLQIIEKVVQMTSTMSEPLKTTSVLRVFEDACNFIYTTK